MEDSEVRSVDILDGVNVAKEMKGTKRKISLASCEACGAEEAKYRCPACLKHSCSLPCVKKHKSESGCNGVRNKTSFVPMSRFGEMTMLSDYRFLEDAGRLSDSISRDLLHFQRAKTKRVKILRQGARRLNVDLKLLPSVFTKSRENTTFFSIREQRIYWHMKLLFPEGRTEYTERSVPDNKTVEEILTRYIHPTESEPVKRQKLKVYVRDAFDGVRVFMKVENRKSNSVRYHELVLQDTLLKNLRNKTIIEYPVLHISLKGQSERYVLLEKEPETAGCSIATCDIKVTDTFTEPNCTKPGTTTCIENDELEDGEIRESDDAN